MQLKRLWRGKTLQWGSSWSLWEGICRKKKIWLQKKDSEYYEAAQRYNILAIVNDHMPIITNNAMSFEAFFQKSRKEGDIKDKDTYLLSELLKTALKLVRKATLMDYFGARIKFSNVSKNIAVHSSDVNSDIHICSIEGVWILQRWYCKIFCEFGPAETMRNGWNKAKMATSSNINFK